ncbi:putative glycoside hydrolase [Nocardioides sp.]|uniref:putative glycoside hydrolase n=1 Tax=Nocardioides sp. TaxID=35761 RepID=UPI0035652815
MSLSSPQDHPPGLTRVSGLLFAVLVIAMISAMVAVLGNNPAHGRPASAAASQTRHDGDVDARDSRTRPSASAGTLALNWGDIQATPDAHLSNYVVLQSWEYGRIPELRRKNPDIRVLMYKDVSATVKRACRTAPDGSCTLDNEFLPTGVGYHSSLRDHPEWFLRDRGGRQLEWSDWPGLFPMDVGDAAYQRSWRTNVLHELRSYGWDGVLMDDVLTTLSHDVYDDLVSPTIPDDAAMYAATESFLAAVGPAIRDEGFEVIANVAFQYDDYVDVLEAWTRYVTGWENEYFVKWSLGAAPRFVGADWNWKMLMSAWCAERDVPLLAVTYSTKADRAAQDFHRATWLLTWNGRTGSSMFVPEEDHTDHWIPRATVEIGTPRGDRRHLRRGVWRRNYTEGVVLVNPTGARRVVRLHGRYRKANGRVVTKVRLRPSSGIVLRRP